MEAKAQKEHEWLRQMLGEWVVETVAEDGKHIATGQESVRSLGDLWVVAEGEGKMGDGPTGYWQMTVGYDIDEECFVGSWYGSMMANMFVYNGHLDPDGKVLTLDTLGPDMKGEGRETRYQDVIEIEGPDSRTMTGRMLTDAGWTEIMKTSFRRKA